MGLAPQIKLGTHEYDLVPQKLPRLERKLTNLNELLNLDVGEDGANFVGALGDQAHTLLQVFIPNLFPLWEWKGFGSQEDYDHFVNQGEDRRTDSSEQSAPDIPQIVDAFRVAAAVNRIDLFKHLGNLVGTDFLRAAARKMIADQLSPETGSSTSSATNTESIPTTS